MKIQGTAVKTTGFVKKNTGEVAVKTTSYREDKYSADRYGTISLANVWRFGEKSVNEACSILRIVQERNDLVGGIVEGIGSRRPSENEEPKNKLEPQSPDHWAPFHLKFGPVYCKDQWTASLGGDTFLNRDTSAVISK